MSPRQAPGRRHEALTARAVERAEQLCLHLGVEPDVRKIDKRRTVVWPTVEVREDGGAFLLVLRGEDGDTFRTLHLADDAARAAARIGELHPPVGS